MHARDFQQAGEQVRRRTTQYTVDKGVGSAFDGQEGRLSGQERPATGAGSHVSVACAGAHRLEC